MARSVGVIMTDYIAVGVVEDNRLSGPVRRFPEDHDDDVFSSLASMPAEDISQYLCEHIQEAIGTEPVSVVGIGMPGVVRNGIIEESPNLKQMKGVNIQHSLALKDHPGLPVVVFNDADVVAAGIAAVRGQLDRLIRVWTLGNGIGFGRYPWVEGVWEGGHTVVTLDHKEQYCGCGGIGHLEGIMGHRAMRLRFLDMEPDEVFEAARKGDPRCADFAKLWHRALAAATATSVHMDGPGKFFITGPSSHFLDVNELHMHMQEMVKMSALQGYVFEVIPGSEEIAIVGAAVNAQRATMGSC